MAVAENAPNFDNSSDSNAQNDLENPKPKMDSSLVVSVEPNLQSNGDDQNPQLQNQNQNQETFAVPASNHKAEMGEMQNGFESNGVDDDHQMVKSGGYGTDQSSNGDENFKHDMRDLEELLSKLNPMAQEFIPLSLANNQGFTLPGGFGYTNNLLLHTNSGNVNGFMGKRVCVNFYFFDKVQYFRFGCCNFRDDKLELFFFVWFGYYDGNAYGKFVGFSLSTFSSRTG